MSKNIIIKQDGTAQSFENISIIGTRNDSGSGDWIPEDESRTTYKRITKNGQYVAQERDNVNGYTAVFVNVPLKTVTGIGEDGHTYKVEVDSQGNLVKTQID